MLLVRLDDAYGDIRADNAADVTLYALFRRHLNHKGITLLVEFRTYAKSLLGTGGNAQAARFATDAFNQVQFCFFAHLQMQRLLPLRQVVIGMLRQHG